MSKIIHDIAGAKKMFIKAMPPIILEETLSLLSMYNECMLSNPESANKGLNVIVNSISRHSATSIEQITCGVNGCDYTIKVNEASLSSFVNHSCKKCGNNIFPPETYNRAMDAMNNHSTIVREILLSMAKDLKAETLN